MSVVDQLVLRFGLRAALRLVLLRASYLELVADNILLPDALRGRAREAALRVAEAAVHLEYLPDVIELEEGRRLSDSGS